MLVRAVLEDMDDYRGMPGNISPNDLYLTDKNFLTKLMKSRSDDENFAHENHYEMNFSPICAKV